MVLLWRTAAFWSTLGATGFWILGGLGQSLSEATTTVGLNRPPASSIPGTRIAMRRLADPALILRISAGAVAFLQLEIRSLSKRQTVNSCVRQQQPSTLNTDFSTEWTNAM